MAIVAAAQADADELAEAVDEQESEDDESPDDGSDAQGEGSTGSTARPKRQRKEPDRHDPDKEGSRPQRASSVKKKALRNAGYRDDDVDAVFRGEVEKFISSLTTELARR